MADAFFSFVAPEHSLVAGVAVTTETCQEAQALHRVAETSCIALGRLLTATALTGLVQHRGAISLQVVSEGHLGKLFADVTPEGHLRGTLDNPTIAMSRPGGAQPGRRSIGSAVGRGILSVIRLGTDREFAQSAVDLASGEIDDDMEFFLETSDQVPTALVCDVILDEGALVWRAGGMLVQALPGGDAALIAGLKKTLRQQFARLVAQDGIDAIGIARRLLPGAELAEPPMALGWRCRCSPERAKAGLKMLPPSDLAEMVDAKENAEVRCDFCSHTYIIPADDVEQAFFETIKAKVSNN